MRQPTLLDTFFSNYDLRDKPRASALYAAARRNVGQNQALMWFNVMPSENFFQEG